MRAPQLVEVATLSPGQCFTCGTVQGPFVDTMVDLPIDGRVYLCRGTCVTPMAELFGLGPVAPLLERVADRDAQLEDALATVAMQRQVIDAFGALKLSGTVTSKKPAKVTA